MVGWEPCQGSLENAAEEETFFAEEKHFHLKLLTFKTLLFLLFAIVEVIAFR